MGSLADVGGGPVVGSQNPEPCASTPVAPTQPSGPTLQLQNPGPMFGVPCRNFYRSHDQMGYVLYVLPPSPAGHRGLNMHMCPDWVRHEDWWQRKEPRQVGGGSVDTLHILDSNFRLNVQLDNGWRDWKELWDREAGKTCVIASCGPSLTESVPEILQLASRPDVFTLGINRATRVLDLDYFVAIDRRAQPDWIAEDQTDTIFIGATTVQTRVALRFKQRYWGECCVASQHAPISNMATSMGITLTDAMMAAYKLGAKKLLMFGCDFAISGRRVVETEDDKPYFEVDQYYFDTSAKDGLAIRKAVFPQVFPVYGRNDRLVFTNYELSTYATYAAAMADMLRHGGVPVENHTPQGIFYPEGVSNGDTLLAADHVCEAEVPR